MTIEACAVNLAEAIRAEKLGAQRIELCDNLHVGGTTPSAGTIMVTAKKLSIPINVLIRPRGGPFVYTPEEIEIMKQDIQICKDAGVEGIVIGVLTKERAIDIALLKEFVEFSQPLKVTFHKAIDKTADIIAEFKKLLDTEVDYVLTSGGEADALAGAAVINEMQKISNGRIKIIAAGTITKDNLIAHRETLNVDEFHGQKILGELF